MMNVSLEVKTRQIKGVKKLQNSPTKVPTKNGKSGTPITGEVMLMNQLGRNGVMRKNII